MLPKQDLLYFQPFTILTINNHSTSSLYMLPNYRKPHTLQILPQFLFPESRRIAPDCVIAWRHFACRQAEHQCLHKPSLFVPATKSTLLLVFIPITYIHRDITIHI